MSRLFKQLPRSVARILLCELVVSCASVRLLYLLTAFGIPTWGLLLPSRGCTTGCFRAYCCAGWGSMADAWSIFLTQNCCTLWSQCWTEHHAASMVSLSYLSLLSDRCCSFSSSCTRRIASRARTFTNKGLEQVHLRATSHVQLLKCDACRECRRRCFTRCLKPARYELMPLDLFGRGIKAQVHQDDGLWPSGKAD